MNLKKIVDLPEITDLTIGDKLIVNNGGAAKQIDVDVFVGKTDFDALKTNFDALASSVVSVYSGDAEPTADMGEDGDVYLVTEQKEM